MVGAFRGLLAAAVVATVAFAGTASATPYFGFNDNSVGSGQATPDVSAQLASDAGANVSRTVFNWREAESTPGNLQLGTWDSIYNADLAKGIRPIFILVNAPRWALPDGVTCAPNEDCRYPPDPSHDDAWRAIVTTLVTRYPQLAALEIWNEPNLRTGWQSPIDPARYADLVKQADTAAHDANSTVPILAAMGATYVGTDPSIGMTYRTFLTRVYQAGVAGHMDGLSIHDYPLDIDLWRIYKILTEVREIRDGAGDSATKIWITETGASTTDYVNPYYTFDLNDQAVIIKQVILHLRAMPDIASTVVHTLINPTDYPADSPERGFGVLRPEPDYQVKPAYCALASLNGTSFSCPIGVMPPTNTAAQSKYWAAQDLVQSAGEAARQIRLRTGTYVGINSTALHAQDPSISATPALQANAPGALADPSRMYVSVTKTTAGVETLVVCNASQSDRSYCIKTSPGAGWNYAYAKGSIGAAVKATQYGPLYW